MERCLLLAARRFDFRDDRGQQVEGVTLTYLTGDVEKSANHRGCEPLKITAPVDVFHQVQAVPGVYDMDFKQRPGKNGRPTLQVVSVAFVEAIDGLLRAVQVPA